MILSIPNSSITLGAVPVTLANVFIPASRSPAAINLVTLDLPLVPLTCILSGMVFNAFKWSWYSKTPKNQKKY